MSRQHHHDGCNSKDKYIVSEQSTIMATEKYFDNLEEAKEHAEHCTKSTGVAYGVYQRISICSPVSRIIWEDEV